MRRTAMATAACIASLLLAGCDGESHETSPMVPVEEVHRRSAVPIDPQPIGYPDIAEYELYGPNCAFAPEGGGLGAIAIAREQDGYMKLRGKMRRFAADSGSAQLPMDARSRYTGEEHTFVLTLEGDDPKGGKGHLIVRNQHEIPVYEASGTIQCNAG